MGVQGTTPIQKKKKMDSEQGVEDLEQHTEQTVQTMENMEAEQTVEELQRKTKQTEQTEQILGNVELKTEQIQMTDNVGTEQGVDSVDAEKRVDSAGPGMRRLWKTFRLST